MSTTVEAASTVEHSARERLSQLKAEVEAELARAEQAPLGPSGQLALWSSRLQEGEDRLVRHIDDHEKYMLDHMEEQSVAVAMTIAVFIFASMYVFYQMVHQMMLNERRRFLNGADWNAVVQAARAVNLSEAQKKEARAASEAKTESN